MRDFLRDAVVTWSGSIVNYCMYSLVSGHVEHFADECGGVPAWLDKNTYYTAFTEGWGLYSENPILSDDTDTYKDNLLQKYGMAKWQVRKEKLYNTASCLCDRAFISQSHNLVEKASTAILKAF